MWICTLLIAVLQYSSFSLLLNRDKHAADNHLECLRTCCDPVSRTTIESLHDAEWNKESFFDIFISIKGGTLTSANFPGGTVTGLEKEYGIEEDQGCGHRSRYVIYSKQEHESNWFQIPGAYGLAATKNLLEEGFDVVGFERNQYVGGTWKATSDVTKTSVLPCKFLQRRQVNAYILSYDFQHIQAKSKIAQVISQSQNCG